MPNAAPKRRFSRVLPVLAILLLVLSSHWTSSSSFRTKQQQLVTVARDSLNENSAANISLASNDNVTEFANEGTSNSTIYIITQLQGEWGNHLNKIAVGKVIQLYLRDKHRLNDTQLITLLRSGNKAKRVVPLLKDCFPAMRQWDFGQGGEPKFAQLHKEAKTNFHSLVISKKNGVSNMNESDFTALLDKAVSVLQSNNPLVPRVIYTDAFLSSTDHFLMQHYRNELLQTSFGFSPECCQAVTTKPDPEETVVHLRNFEQEVPRVSKESFGFQEAGPEDMSTKLLGHLRAGDKVAIVGPLGKGRFRTDAANDGKNGMSAHEQILVDRGLQVRLVASDNFVHDFCFLKDAQKELVGLAGSTFVSYAAYFGNTSSVVLYRIGEADEDPRPMQPPLSPLFFSDASYRRRFQTRIISKTTGRRR